MTTTTIPTTARVKVYRMPTPDHECPWGLRAIALLNDKGISFEDIKLRSRQEVDAFKAQHNVTTTPQIFFDEVRLEANPHSSQKQSQVLPARFDSDRV